MGVQRNEFLDNLELTELTVTGVTPILEVFRPTWDISTVQVKQFSAGNYSINLRVGYRKLFKLLFKRFKLKFSCESYESQPEIKMPYIP